MPAAFNIPAILARVRQAEAEALEQVSLAIVADARQRAPIRRVFKERPGFRRKFRPLTGAEKVLAIKRANAYYGTGTFEARRAVAHIRNYAKAQVPRHGSTNAPRASRTNRLLGSLRGNRFTARTDATRVVSRRTGAVSYESKSLNPLLTARGRSEVRSGAAIHIAPTAQGGGSRVEIGGALKASIEAEGAIETGKGMEDRVTAGIRYAKFVEFPTIRTHAQPFLLPALHQNRQNLVKTMAAEVRKALGG
jgi:HK97 gp10 family phage protein